MLLFKCNVMNHFIFYIVLSGIIFTLLDIKRPFFFKKCNICYNHRKAKNMEDEFMALTMYWYPNCGTCKKAKKWFDDRDISYTLVHIVEET